MRKAVFIERVNRFVAKVLLDGQIIDCHLANTGRIKELLIPGAACGVFPATNPNRKTAWDLVFIQQRGRWVCLRSVFANQCIAEWLDQDRLPAFVGATDIKRECKQGDSRFDFSFTLGGKRTFCEVKAVNLVLDDGLALFPDAPSSRGARHIRELIDLQGDGYGAALALVTMGQDANRFRFNWASDPDLAQAALEAYQSGMPIRVYKALFDPPHFYYQGEIPIEWEV